MRFLRWLKNRIGHKLEHFRWSSIKKTLRENGVALVVIIVGWEIIEDVVFPAIFAVLGKYVHPAFFVGIPASLIICLHWFMVPVLWGAWIKIKNKEDPPPVEHQCGGCDDSR
jgi:hypothetical protein